MELRDFTKDERVGLACIDKVSESGMKSFLFKDVLRSYATCEESVDIYAIFSALEEKKVVRRSVNSNTKYEVTAEAALMMKLLEEKMEKTDKERAQQTLEKISNMCSIYIPEDKIATLCVVEQVKLLKELAND